MDPAAYVLGLSICHTSPVSPNVVFILFGKKYNAQAMLSMTKTTGSCLHSVQYPVEHSITGGEVET